MRTTIAFKGADGSSARWTPTTLDMLGKNEAYLETVLAEMPELFLLDATQRRISRPFAVFRQLRFSGPQERAVKPDIVLLAASGDVVIVEVKLFANQELRDRRVIAQAIDYPASLFSLSETEVAQLFSRGSQTDWPAFVRSQFPDEQDPEDLAATLLKNMTDGDVHIVVACDKAPKGAYELAKGVSAQSRLGFSLEVVEVTPFVRAGGSAEEIIFVPGVRLSTEIVARTVVTVTSAQGAPLPAVSVVTTPIEEIEENIASAAQGRTRSKGKSWTNREIEEVFLGSNDPIVRDLFLFVRQESYNGQFQSSGDKVSAAFNFYVRVRRLDGSVTTNAAFQCVDGGYGLRLYLNWGNYDVPADALASYKDGLRELFGEAAVDVSMAEPSVLPAAFDEKLDAFKSLFLEFRDAMATAADG